MGSQLPIKKLLGFILFFWLTDIKLIAQDYPITPFGDRNVILDQQLLLSSSEKDTTKALFEPRKIVNGGKFSLALMPIRSHFTSFDSHYVPLLLGNLESRGGRQLQISSGLRLNWRFLEVQYLPEIHRAENNFEQQFPFDNNYLIWFGMTNWWNSIDSPDVTPAGNDVYKPGQSYVKFSFNSLELKFSTENKFWSPGKYDGLTLTNNIAGFPHVSLAYTFDLPAKLGNVAIEWLSGQLSNSNTFPSDSLLDFNGGIYFHQKSTHPRFLSGTRFVYHSSIVNGFSLGFHNLIQNEWNATKTNDLFGGFSSTLFRNEGAADAIPKQHFRSLYTSWDLYSSHARVYAEFLAETPDQRLFDAKQTKRYKTAWLFGISKAWPFRNNLFWVSDVELTQLQQPSQNTIEQGPGIYTSEAIRQGFTHKGKNIGSSLTTGSNRQTFTFGLMSKEFKINLLVQRINNNNDFYVYHFSKTKDFRRNWIDLTYGIQYYLNVFDKLILNGQSTLINTYNYQWEHPRDPTQPYFAPGIDPQQVAHNMGVMYKF